ncbi:RagB/SusD family nutrient uptake outer membrane protein [Chryseolinea lacunae]|uniref:RagB/SusD family nutrient uptake outer membrane protein n=1 Tax=Chryseolinea lacunae TaxID=2801331 RepID=A0ABS1KTB6_9BACT|nr:RagB/SusD family nutrient uptake outer membrane protein [Chryseolinea lacunae]MBL0742709.1 RagB/SusD family nutrient uptake outer membrane protein [Chryseolinea lacunae]
MKSLRYIILLGFAATILISCDKFLEEDPKGFIATDNFYNTEADAVNAVNAVYFLLNQGGSTVQTPYNTLFNTGLNFECDDEFPGPGATNPDVRSMANLLHTSSNLRVYELWQQHYAAVAKANLALEKIPGINIGAALKGRLIGEAKFLRALWYFNLVRLYGDVPLITKVQTGVAATDFAAERTPSAQVYSQIEQDLKEAADALPNSYSAPDVGRATKGAAISLLAKVYLTKASLPLNATAHYEDAVITAEKALSPADGGTGTFNYALQSDYSKVFLPAFKNNSEHIFSAQFKSGSSSSYLTQGNNQNARSIRTQVPGLAGTYADQIWFYTVDDATKPGGKDKFFSVFKLYTSKDKRRDVTFVTNFKSPTTGKKFGGLNDPTIAGHKVDSIPYFNKAWDPNTTSFTSESAANVAIIRYAELLLIHAEAENELNGPTAKAYKSLNAVRNRAGLDDLTEGLTRDQFRDSLYVDRRLELVFEYQRWFDLVRQKDASGNSIFVSTLKAVGKPNVQDKHRLHPIPQQEIELNAKLQGHQNPGY